jgi:hypothetical protein
MQSRTAPLAQKCTCGENREQRTGGSRKTAGRHDEHPIHIPQPKSASAEAQNDEQEC